MISRQSGRALALSFLCLTAFALPVALTGAATVTNANENAHTLVLSLPGSFNGCSYLNSGATPTTDAILDLVRPSAFITGANGALAGEGGAIAAAELTSLQPETVRYTIAPAQKWSDGVPFTARDLVGWWRRARALSSVVSDGYRAIKTMSVSPDGLAVTAVFATPYADWNLLFRDVEAIGTSKSCAIGNLVTEPSLGPYRVTSATATRVVLAMNTAWPLDTNRFGRIVITDSSLLPKTSSNVYASYSLALNRGQIELLSTYPTLLSHILSSSTVEELTFAPSRPLIQRVVVRRALSWSIDRQNLINKLFGTVTFSPSVAASVVYSQGQSQYPGTSGAGPGGPATTTSAPGLLNNGLSDCLACALDLLRTSGYHRSSAGWLSDAGQLLAIRLGVGPSALDHSVAKILSSDWARLGVSTRAIDESSDTRAAQAAASNEVDAAVFSRPTLSAPSFAARSWAGPAYPNTFPSGVRTLALTSLFTQATAIFNPVTASATWLRLDQIIMRNYWVRPLFTPPSLVVWSSSLATVLNSISVAGLVDQVPTWSIAPTSLPS
ncbi:MAG TPA: ABC transporter substrate-binding protein [Acidimicrobiales bacterium]|nr:ABC transporter substrate-binding protein [Acidimicrobiales bacterium]